MTKVRLLTIGFMVGALFTIAAAARAQELGPPTDQGAVAPQTQARDWPMPEGQAPAPQERSMVRPEQAQADQPGTTEQAERGELGVWLVATEGPGVRIRRITSGSAAEQAGLQTGDIILQVNGEWATTPQALAEIVRKMPIGKAVEMQIWREGQPQKVAATIQAPRRQEIVQQSYEVGFGENEGNPSQGDLGSRTTRLEQQLKGVIQELKQLRQEFAQLHPDGGSANVGEGETGPATDRWVPNPPAATPTTPSTEPAAPAPGFEQPGAETNGRAVEQPVQSPAPPAAEENSPFGSEESQPKTEEKEKSDKAESDSLFQ